MLDNIKDWFENLEPRERWMVSVAGVLVTLTLLYLAVIEPYVEHRRNLAEQVEDQRDLLAWMESARADIKALEASGRQTSAGSGQTLFTIVDRTSKAAELGGAVRQITPDGDDSVRLRMDAARFDHTLEWLQNLESEHGVTVTRVTFDQVDSPGRVNVSLTLERDA